MNRLITMLAVFGTILFVGCNDSTVLDTEEKKDRAAKDIAGAGCDFYNALDSDNEQELSDAVDAFESLMIQHAEDQIYDKDRDQFEAQVDREFSSKCDATLDEVFEAFGMYLAMTDADRFFRFVELMGLDAEENNDSVATGLAAAACDFYNALDSDNEQELNDAVDTFESFLIQFAEVQIFNENLAQLNRVFSKM